MLTVPMAVLAFVCRGAQEDQRDSRIRTFVYPKRIVWQSEVNKFDDGWPERAKAEKMEKLLERKFGQVCEGMFASKSGTRLVSQGEPAGVLLDFGRELHGGVQLGMSPAARVVLACACASGSPSPRR